MSSKQSTVVKNSFFIENILSKPNNYPKPSYQSDAEANDHAENLTSQFLLDANNKRSGNQEVCCESEVKSEIFDKNQNSFATPDSSCCGEEQTEALSDIASEESCKSELKKKNLFSSDTVSLFYFFENYYKYILITNLSMLSINA